MKPRPNFNDLISPAYRKEKDRSKIYGGDLGDHDYPVKRRTTSGSRLKVTEDPSERDGPRVTGPSPPVPPGPRRVGGRGLETKGVSEFTRGAHETAEGPGPVHSQIVFEMKVRVTQNPCNKTETLKSKSVVYLSVYREGTGGTLHYTSSLWLRVLWFRVLSLHPPLRGPGVSTFTVRPKLPPKGTKVCVGTRRKRRDTNRLAERVSSTDIWKRHLPSLKCVLTGSGGPPTFEGEGRNSNLHYRVLRRCPPPPT